MKQVIKNKIKEKNHIVNEETKYTLLCDGNSIMKQSFVDKTVGDNGKVYGMVIQSILCIKNVITKYDFSHCYFLCDGSNSGQLRAYLLPEYKANRDKNYATKEKTEYDKAIDDYVKKVLAYSKKKKQGTELKRSETEEEEFERQRDILIDILENLFVRTAFFEDVEGDDLIAYYVKHKKPNEKIVIITRDRDLTQLISDDVAVFLSDKKKFISKKNHIQEIGYPSENVLEKKILCGDSSDNIKGIKGMGEKTFFDLFPEARERKITIDEVLSTAKKINEERVLNKKKPLKVCENILNGVTDGSQGKNIFEINRKIIDLSEPLMTDEAVEGMESYIDAPLDPSDREYKHIYNIIKEEGMTSLYSEDKFGYFFSCFERLIQNEKNFSKKNK